MFRRKTNSIRQINEDCEEPDSEIEEQIDSLKKQGVPYYYDRNERIRKQRLKNMDTEKGTKKKVYLMGLFSMLTICIFLVIYISVVKGKRSVSGDQIYLTFEFIHPEGMAYDSQIKVKFFPKSEQSVIKKGSTITFDFENNSFLVVKKEITFPKDVPLIKANPLPHMLYVSKGKFFRATRIHVYSSDLKIEGKVSIK